MSLTPNEVTPTQNQTSGRTHMVTITVAGIVNLQRMNTRKKPETGEWVTEIVVARNTDDQ